MNHSRSLTHMLSPALMAIALSAFIAGCTAPSNDDGMSASSKSEAMMEVSSSSSISSNAVSSMDAMQTSSTAMSTPASTMATSSKPAVEAMSTYKDGTYNADGVYRSPAGAEEIAVTLTLKDDVITSAQVTGAATNGKSIKMQEAFIAGFGAQVVGKPIDSLSLGVVNGSSLTPAGFMNAVAKIKAEAM